MQPSSEKYSNLVNRWYEASSHNLNTTERMKLYEDTEEIVSFLENNQQISDTASVADTVLQNFDNRGIGESELLALWIAKNTQQGESGQYEGAYNSLHRLFEKLADLKEFPQAFEPEVDPSNFDWRLSSIVHIDSSSLSNIQRLNKEFPLFEDADLRKAVYSQDLKSLDRMSIINKGYQKQTQADFIDLLALGKVDFPSMGINSIEDLAKYLGKEGCSQVTTLKDLPFHFLYSIESDPTFVSDDQKGGILTKNFPHLKKVSLQPPNDLDTLNNLTKTQVFAAPSKTTWDLDLSFLQVFPSLEALYLNQASLVTNLNYLKYVPQLKDLRCNADPNLTDLSALLNVPNLETLDLSGCIKLSNFEPIKNLTKLKQFAIEENPHITNFKFLENLKELEILFMCNCPLVDDFSSLDKLLKLITVVVSEGDEVAKEISKENGLFSSLIKKGVFVGARPEGESL